MLFESLLLWNDGLPRSGPENMAVDEWLLETAEVPVLRVYSWAGDWASIGYFGKLEEAKALFPGVNLVRRWTGGGMVDHRRDWTYTLVAPSGTELAGMRGAESYRAIHSILAVVLPGLGVPARLSAGENQTGASLCFENPVSHDLVGADGRKLAGAGQRRTKRGLLHQGSLALPVDLQGLPNFSIALAEKIGARFGLFPSEPEMRTLMEFMNSRYDRSGWLSLR